MGRVSREEEVQVLSWAADFSSAVQEDRFVEASTRELALAFCFFISHFAQQFKANLSSAMFLFAGI